MNDTLWLDPTSSLRLCLTLLHSLWIVSLLAGIAWLADRLWQRSVERRYSVHVAALLAGLLALPVTYALVNVSVGNAEFAQANSAPVIRLNVEPHAVPPDASAAARPAFDSEPAPPIETSATAPSVATTSAALAPASSGAVWTAAARWIAALYALGVFVMLARLAHALLAAQRQAAGASPILHGHVFDTLAGLAREWSLRIVPVVAVAEKTAVPQVVGLLRPMILLPVSSLTGLTVDELRMILAHELAHVRRHDLWVNLLQRLAETVLFFNPALWYLTRRISMLREFCCDEMTCGTLPSAEPTPRTRYAAALLRVAELSRPTHVDTGDIAALAAVGRAPSELRRRIAHLFGEPIREPLRLSRGGMLTLAISAALFLAIPGLWPSRSDTAVGASTSSGAVTPSDATDVPRQSESAASDFDNGFMEISGGCTSAAGAPIADAEVRLYHRDNPSFAVTLLRTVHTDNDGRFQLATVRYPSMAQRSRNSEPYALAVKAAGHGSTLRFIPIGFGRQVTIDFSLKPAATVQGTLTGPDLKPIADADVWIHGIGLGPLDGILSSRSDADGHFEIMDADAWKAGDSDSETSSGRIVIRSLYLRVRHPEYGTQIGEFTSAPSTSVLNFKPGGIVGGRVVNVETGEPAAGVLVRACSQKGLTIGSEYFTTDEQGRYRVVLPESTYNLWVHHDELTAHAIEGLAITSGVTATAPDLQLIKGGLIEGQLLDAASGEPMKLQDQDIADILVSGPTRPDSTSAVQVEPINPDGSFRFRLPPGRSMLALPSSNNVRLNVRRVERSDRRGAEVKTSSAAGIQDTGADATNAQPAIKTDDPPQSDQPGSVTIDISGRALDPQGQPIANARIYASSPREVEKVLVEATTDADGRYRLTGVAVPIRKADTNGGHDTAVFEVFGLAEGHGLAFRSFNVMYPEVDYIEDLRDTFGREIDPPLRFGRKDPIELDLQLGPSYSIRGRLVDDQSRPIAGAGLKIRWGDVERDGLDSSFESPNANGVVPASFRERTTDADGRFEFSGLPADVIWSIDIKPQGHSPRRVFASGVARADYQGHTVYSGDFEIVFPRPHDVTIQVVFDDNGESAPKVGVGGMVVQAGFWETTDENGLVHVRLPKGTFSLTASPRYQTPYLNTTSEIVVGDEPLQQPHTIRLRPAGVVELTVTDADTGQPLAGADVWIEQRTARGEPYREVHAYQSWEVETRLSHYECPRSDENGRMRVNFEPGRHVIGIGHETFPVGYVPVDADGIEVECTAGQVTKVELQMRRAAGRAGRAPPPAATELAAQAAAHPAKDSAETTRRFELLVVDPQGNPVQQASVELRISPQPTKNDVQVGEFVKESTYGSLAQTDAAGRLVFTYADAPRDFNLNITTPGYGPYWAEWSSDEHPQAIPAQFTAELEAGWSVGGIVVDEQGEPVAGVQVKPSISFKKRPGDEEHLGLGTRIKTDDAGRWRFDSVPDSMSEVGVEVSHPSFAPHRRGLTRAEFGLQMDQTPTASITLPRGLTVTGHVADADGKPIEGALLRTKFSNDIREARTDVDGNYRLAGCEPRMTRLVVSAPGRATDMQVVRIDPDMRPVNFTMQPGGKVRIRVVDEQGQEIPKARIFLQRWRGMVDYFEFDHKNQYADEHGVWEWNEAPVDEFQADICRPDGMQLTLQKLIPRNEEYVFSPSRALVAFGNVVDATTKEPIKTFRVTPGVRNENSQIRVNWNTSESYDATDGTYRIRFSNSYPAQRVRIEANGYQVAVSRDIRPDEGETDIGFELQPAPDIAATILTPDGQPATGAKVALALAGMQVQVRNGDMDDGSTYATRRDAAADGSFRFPSRSESFQLVITHPTGYAWFKSPEQEPPETIHLTPWARIEGVFRVGAQPMENVTLTLSSFELWSHGRDSPRIYTFHKATTGPGGRYVFERAVPGKGRIGRNILLMVNDGATEVTSSIQIPVNLPAGEVTTLNLGGNGRAVIGRLSPKSDADQPVLWNFALINAYVGSPLPNYPTPPADVQNDPDRLEKWWQEWGKSPEGNELQQKHNAAQERRSAGPRLTATVDRDGSFRIDDVPPGEYVLDVRFNSHDRTTEHPPGSLREHAMSVPPGDDPLTDPPVELGDLQLQ